MGKKQLSDALKWARIGVAPAMKLAPFARALGVARTTYYDYEEGNVTPPESVVIEAGRFRGFQDGWYKRPIPKLIANETRRTYARKRTEASSDLIITPTVPTPSIGMLTEGSLKDEELQQSTEPISIPVNMSSPDVVAAIADQEDSGDTIPHGAVMLFSTSKKGIVGRRVSFKKLDGTSSLRLLVWDNGRLLYRGHNGQKDLTREEGTEEGLLVGVIFADRPGRFKGEYESDGDLDL